MLTEVLIILHKSPNTATRPSDTVDKHITLLYHIHITIYFIISQTYGNTLVISSRRLTLTISKTNLNSLS